MTRIVVSVIKSAVFILGIVLASCFIGRGCELQDEARCWCSAAFHRAP